MNATANSPEEDPRPIQVDSIAVTTSQRVSTLLGIVNVVRPCLIEDPDSLHGSGRFDGGIKTAAEVTLINTLDRLDKIVSDEAIWHTVPLERSIAEQLEELHKLRTAVETERLKGMQHLNRPFNRYHASVSFSGGRFIAHLGNLDSPTTIKAYGDSIESAIDAFDALVSKAKGNT